MAVKNGLTDAGMSQENFLLTVWELSGRQPKILKPKDSLTVLEAGQRIDSGFVITADHVMQCSGFCVGNRRGHEDKKVELLVYA